MHHADRVIRANASETTRVETFSDAVFAISMTLLGLALKVPRTESDESLLVALGREWPAFLSVVTSFVTISIVWINHHRLFTHIPGARHWIVQSAVATRASIIFDVAFAVFFALPAFTISDAGFAKLRDASAEEDAGVASG